MSDVVNNNNVEIINNNDVEPIPGDYGTKTTIDELPLCYHYPQNKEEEILCMLGLETDSDGNKIEGSYCVYIMNLTTEEQKMAKFNDLDHLDRYRNEIILSGWKMVKPPKTRINNAQSNAHEPNRKERRALERENKKIEKQKLKKEQSLEERKRQLTKELQKRKAFAEAIRRDI